MCLFKYGLPFNGQQALKGLALLRLTQVLLIICFFKKLELLLSE